jgi:hypothetical protein
MDKTIKMYSSHSQGPSNPFTPTHFKATCGTEWHPGASNKEAWHSWKETWWVKEWNHRKKRLRRLRRREHRLKLMRNLRLCKERSNSRPLLPL